VAKARDGKMIYGSTGVGGGLHLSMEMLMMQTGIHMVHVPYKGAAAAVPDLIAGRIETMFGSAPALMPHVRSGRIRALGVSSAKRVPSLPDIPTLSESGLPGYESTSITTLAVPTGTPRAVIAKLNGVINQAARSNETLASLTAQGTEAAAMTPEQTTQTIRDEVVKWNKVIAAAGVKGE
jgi:tripartite-type tricarboxylate transporter receptor subunit TctC